MATDLISVAVFAIAMFGAGYGFRLERERAKGARR